MRARPKVSVVIPMYNVEAYLEQCVESVRAQTLTDIEIVLVDDESPDRCGAMAEEYSLRDERIKVVHRPNGGLGPARNSGIKVATGEYVGFVDSDDWVEPGMYEALYKVASAHSARIAFTGIKTVSHGEVMAVREQPLAGRVLRGHDEVFQVRAACFGALPCKLKDDPTPVSVCTGIYELDFLNTHSLRFRNVRSEDKFFNTEVGRYADVVACIGGAPYCYRKDDQPSITKTFDRRTVDSFFRLFRLLEQMADEEPDEFWWESHIRASRCVIDYSRVLIGMIEGSSSNEAERRRFVREVCEHSALARACKGYPFWKLPIAQAAFFLALKIRSVHFSRFLVKLRKGAQ